jgi:RNA polymerase sigma-70 factor (ECF subfamily)
MAMPAEDNIAATWEADWEDNLVEAALERVKKDIAPKQFQIFDLAMVKHWSTARIAKALAVNPGYVYLVKHRVRARLKKEVKKLRRDPCEPQDDTGPDM